MTAQAIVCGTCAAAVPQGRLSCPSCGELLASVARGGRVVAGTIARPSVPDVLYEAGAAPTKAVVDGQLSLESVGRDPAAVLPWATVDIGLDDEDDDDDDEPTDRSSVSAGPAWAVGGMSLNGSSTPSYLPRPPFGAAVQAGAAAIAVPAFAQPAFAGPGAYLPPVPVVSVPAGPPAPARAWAGHGNVAEGGADATAADRSSAAADPAGDRARLAEFVRSLSVAGAAFSAVGFLLPWGIVVIGASGTGYFDRWGLAGPAHVVVVLGLLAVLALALIGNAIPVWIRTGLAGLGLGALVLGLVWPYLIGPLGSGPGALIVAIGAVALAVSGILALITDRHAGVHRSV